MGRLNDELTKRAHQFRVIEKRLLVRLKDRNPAPLQNLELLFEGTYQQLLELADATDNAQQQLKFHGTRLSAGTRLLLLLIRLRFQLDADDAALLEAHLSPLVDETPDQGWEERTDAALAHLLRTGLAKSSKESSSAAAAHQLTRPADAAKLKKHITLVCDRLHKGLRPRAADRGEGKERKQRERTAREGGASSSSSSAAAAAPPPPMPPSPHDRGGAEEMVVVAGQPVALPPQEMPAPPAGSLPQTVSGAPLPPVHGANGARPHHHHTLNADRPLPSPPE